MTVSEIQDSTAERSRTSRTVVETWPPDEVMSLAAELRSDSLISDSERMAPREARSLAVAKPIPEAAPVRVITFPWKLVDIVVA